MRGRETGRHDAPSDSGSSFRHVLLTRFNVRMRGTADQLPDSWLVSRLSLFEQFTLPAIRSQTKQPDSWLIFCDDRSPGWFRTQLGGLLPEPHYEALWVSEVFGGDVCSRAVEERIRGGKYLITTRVDNDDIVARDFIQEVQAQFDEQERQFVNFTHGAQTTKGRMYLRSDPSNAFVSLIERRGSHPPLTVFIDGHDRLREHGHVAQVLTHPMWIQVIHGGNLANVVHGIRTDPRKVLKYFDVQPLMEEPRRLELETDRAISALRLALRISMRPHRLRWAARVFASDIRGRKDWVVRVVARLARPLVVRLRPLRRRLAMRLRPRNFKETYVNEALRITGGSTYVEIGVREGDSMREIRAPRRIGIDPTRPKRNLTNVQHFEKTSDAFFSQDARALFASTGIDVALIDGMHEFRQALRDLINLESHMNPGGVIVLDDLNPLTELAASDRPTGGHWNGDVWKIAAFLRDERPNLILRTVDADQGIGIVTGFAGGDAEWPSSDTVELYKQLDYEHLRQHRRTLLNLVPPAPLSRLLARGDVADAKTAK